MLVIADMNNNYEKSNLSIYLDNMKIDKNNINFTVKKSQKIPRFCQTHYQPVHIVPKQRFFFFADSR